MNLSVQPLTREAFARFGDVIGTAGAPHSRINQGNAERYRDLCRLEAGDSGRIVASIYRAQPRALPFTVQTMERHPLGSQAFVPLDRRPYLVVVALPGPAPARGDLVAFLARGDQGVNYAAGVWHHPLLALDAVSDFLVLEREGPGANCDEVTIEGSAVIRTLPVVPGA